MAGKSNLYLAKAVKYLDRLSGYSAREWRNKADVLAEASKKNITPLRAERMAQVAKGRAFQTRAKTGVTVGSVGAGSYLGMKNHQKRKQDRLLRKIEHMYQHQNRYY